MLELLQLSWQRWKGEITGIFVGRYVKREITSIFVGRYVKSWLRFRLSPFHMINWKWLSHEILFCMSFKNTEEKWLTKVEKRQKNICLKFSWTLPVPIQEIEQSWIHVLETSLLSLYNFLGPGWLNERGCWI